MCGKNAAIVKIKNKIKYQYYIYYYDYHHSSYYDSSYLPYLIASTNITEMESHCCYSILTGFIRLQQVLHLWPYEREPILYRQLFPDEDNRETFKHIFKNAKMSYHIFDCKVENIPEYMKQIVDIENSTQYSVSFNFFLFCYQSMLLLLIR